MGLNQVGIFLWYNFRFCEGESIVTSWEALGVENCRELLTDMGFNSKLDIRLLDLTSVLEDELNREDEVPPDPRYIHAAIATYQSEVRYLR